MTNDTLKAARATDVEEKDKIRADLAETDDILNVLSRNFNKFSDDATRLSEDQCTELFNSCMGEFLKTRGKSASGDESERDQKRMYSFK